MLNFAQFSSTTALNATIEEVRGEADPALMGRLQSSVEDRNWDSIEDLWKMKEEIAGDDELRAIFEGGETAADILRGLEGSERGRRFVAEKLEPHQQAFGYKAIWSHEFAFKTWVENPAPIIEAVRGYLATDYDYPANIKAVADDLETGQGRGDGGRRGRGSASELQQALDLSLGMNPLTPDHHFYIDQGANARVRLVAIAIGRKLVEAGALDDPEDVIFLHYNELRLLMADQGAFDARELVSDRRDEQEEAYERRPPSWAGTATEEALAFPYNALWGFPDKFYAGEPATTGEVKGLAASPGVIEGPARYVSSLDEFDQVEQGDILVCRMTNPAWVVLFTKISGLVTEAGGAVSHPAVVAREFGIPAVVGTSNAGQRIKTGRPDPGERLDGRRGAAVLTRWLAPTTLDEALALRAEHGDGATVLAGGTFLGILMNQGFIEPEALLSLGGVAGLDGIALVDGELRVGAMVTHRALERSPAAAALAGAAARVRPRGQPARAQPGDGRRRAGRRRLRVRPAGDARGARRARRPALAARRARGDGRGADPRPLRDLHRARRAARRGARAGRSPSARSTASSARARPRTGRAWRSPPRAATAGCASWSARSPARRSRSRTCARSPTARRSTRELATEIGRRYAERIEPISDARGSAAYRRRVVAVEVRRALEELA